MSKIDEVQGHLEQPYRDSFCARMYLIRFAHRTEAQAAIRALLPHLHLRGRSESPKANLALTYRGLRGLGLSALELAEFPDAFRQGMMRRAELLGDVYERADDEPQLAPTSTFHALLIVYATPNDSMKHTLLQLGENAHERTSKATTGDWSPFSVPLKTFLDATCDPLVRKLGLEARCVQVQDLHQPLIGSNSDPEVVEYFGFRDGVSQPPVTLEPEGAQSLASILVRSDSPLLDKGTYLVVRQLEQDVRGFWRAMEKNGKEHAQTLAERVVGRKMNGAPLAPNAAKPEEAFDPETDAEGRGCPFHSHVRRVNPRLDPKTTPRVLRRGMSYLEKSGKRGLMFMAFNADISAQFEFLQRNWVQRGSSVGLSAADHDPIAGLAEKNTRSNFSCEIDGKPALLSIPSFVRLRWGGYFWLPSVTALERIASNQSGAEVRTNNRNIEKRLADAGSYAARRALIESWIDDPDSASDFWEFVATNLGYRLQPETNDQRGFAFVANPTQVDEILEDDGTRYSASEYGSRMVPAIGPFFLGMDPGSAAAPQYKREWPSVAIIPTSPSDLTGVRACASEATRAYLKAMEAEAQLAADGRPVRVVVEDMLAVVLGVTSAQVWGVAGPAAGSLLEWEKDLAFYFFRAFADPIDRAKALESGGQIRTHVTRLVEAAQSLAGASANPKLTATLAAMTKALGGTASTDELVRNLLGILAGSLAATFTAFSQGLTCYAEPNKGKIPFPTVESAQSAPSFFSSMIAEPLAARKRGAPESLYRVANQPFKLDNGTEVPANDIVVLWFGGRLSENQDALFGGGTHACPGIAMAKSIIDGVLATLRERMTEIKSDLRAIDRDFELRLEYRLP